ncbi:MAG: isoleucine--tRNA ligase, partial [Planctomycetota bacterium]
FVVRSRSMMGFDCPYTPGWDCHGLPIEHKVMQELGPAGKEMDPLKVRKKCESYAKKFVKTQSAQMQRLLTLADYDDPYLTMLPKYEAGVLEVFAGMIERGLVYRDLKPVHWSVDNQTALAEAELEYYDREDTSVYVWFASQDDPDVGFMIWTTTPWTLPANLAVAVHPRFEYGLYDLGENFGHKKAWIANELAGKVLLRRGVELGEPLDTKRGEELVGLTYGHAFVERTGNVVAAEYVTVEDGTGLVHTAPGHGAEDYQTGLREGLDVYCPVRADGTYDDTVPDWLKGESIWKANSAVVERLRDSGHLFFDETFTHSYPHDWRGKKPVIFRATEQWFIGVDREICEPTTWSDDGLHRTGESTGKTLRAEALKEVTDKTQFYPAWGRNRMRGMLEGRPDWCVSRQRAWGLPIPAFFNDDGEVLMTADSVRAVSSIITLKGSDAWFYMKPKELLEFYDSRLDPDAPSWIHGIYCPEDDPNYVELYKCNDTFDVWFESGSSWNSVLCEGWVHKQAGKKAGGDSGDAFPAALYLEGSDQHRGWFQHSLLPALAVTGQPPFGAILTHGFMVDKDGRKMSKSTGNALKVDELMKQYGADVCRWWVASLNVDNDIKVDASFFKLAGESYRKVRNTLRFLLSNLNEFDPASVEATLATVEPTHLEAWLLREYATLCHTVRGAYERYAYREAHAALFDFCNDTLSAVYLAAVKDRMYCDGVDSPRRVRAQAAMFTVADGLCRLLAPLLPHTADEAFAALHGDETCVHLALLPEPAEFGVADAWAEIMQQRDLWLKAMEEHGNTSTEASGKGKVNPLDLGLFVPGDWPGIEAIDLADLCGVSRVTTGAETLAVRSLAEEPRCERSWKRDGTVKERSDGGWLSDRDAAAMGLA